MPTTWPDNVPVPAHRKVKLHAHPKAPRIIETKVSLPAIVTGLLGIGGGAVYAALLAYEVMDPTPEQAAALAGLGSFVLYAVQTITGYYAAHTPRPDLDPPERVVEDELAEEGAGPDLAPSPAGGGAVEAPGAMRLGPPPPELRP